MEGGLTREMLVVALSIIGTVAAGRLWMRGRHAVAALCFLAAAAVMAYLVARWNITVGL